MTRQFLSSTLPPSADPQISTPTPAHTICCRHLLSAARLLRPAFLTREPESLCSFPTWHAHEWRVIHSLFAVLWAFWFTGLKKWRLSATLVFIDLTFLNQTISPSSDFFFRIWHHNVKFTCVILIQVGRVKNLWQTKLSSSLCQIRFYLYVENCPCTVSLQFCSHHSFTRHADGHIAYCVYVFCSVTAFPSATPFCKVLFENCFPVFRSPEECLI